MSVIKTKHRNKLHVEASLVAAVATVEPRIANLIGQEHKSKNKGVKRKTEAKNRLPSSSMASSVNPRRKKAKAPPTAPPGQLEPQPEPPLAEMPPGSGRGSNALIEPGSSSESGSGSESGSSSESDSEPE
jgi:hypothetical protein